MMADDQEFLLYSSEPDESSSSSCSCCQRLHECCGPLSVESLANCFLCSLCCCCTPEEKPAEKFTRIQYRPVIDSNIITGNTLLRTAEGSYYFPQTSHTLWPQHGAQYRRTHPVVSEQPLGSDKIRRSTRFLAAIRGRRRTPSTAASLSPHQHQFLYDPTSPLPSLAHSSIEEPEQPTLTFALAHDIQTSTLTVFLKFASNLNHLFDNPKRTISHCFITIHILPSANELLQTSTNPSNDSNNNPVFNEQFVFDGVPVSEVDEHIIIFRVYNGRSLIGISKIPMFSMDLLGYTVCKHIDRITSADLEARKSSGDVQLSLTYNAEAEVIDGVILRVTNLRRHLISIHPPRPYVNIYLTHDGKRYAKWKSSVHYDTAVELFNETFQFNISKMDTSLVKLCIHIKEFHRTHFNNLLGVVEIGATAEGAGSIHWQEILTSPGQKVSHWHCVVPQEGTHAHPPATSSEMIRATST